MQIYFLKLQTSWKKNKVLAISAVCSHRKGLPTTFTDRTYVKRNEEGICYQVDGQQACVYAIQLLFSKRYNDCPKERYKRGKTARVPS